MYTPDARQQWVGWHSRIVGERGWTGAYWEGGHGRFFLGGGLLIQSALGVGAY